MNAGALDWSSVPIVTRKWPVRGEARGLETHRGGGSGGGMMIMMMMMMMV